jgi:hypothetical protein
MALALLALLANVPAHAAERLALVIGNDGYRHLAPLSNARNDARLMAQLLREARFDVTVAEDVDRLRFWRAVDALRTRIRKGDEVVVFFAGHGVQVGSDPVLLPVDLAADSEEQVMRDGVALVQLQEAIKDARLGLLIVDACRDNPFPKRGTRSIGGTRGLAPIEAAEGVAILLSAGRGQTALDSVPGDAGGNGLFTHSLVRTLRNPAVGVREALLETRDRVETEARKVGHTQRPALVDEMRGDFRIFGAADASGAAAPLVRADGGGAAVSQGATAIVAAAPRRVLLLWEAAGGGGRQSVLPVPVNAEVEAAFVQALQTADIPLALAAESAEAPLAQRIGAAAGRASHVLVVSVLADARSPLGAGFQVSLRSAGANDLVLARYSLAQPEAAAPQRRYRYVPGDTGFRREEITEPAAVRPADAGRVLADEVRDAIKRALQ